MCGRHSGFPTPLTWACYAMKVAAQPTPRSASRPRTPSPWPRRVGWTSQQPLRCQSDHALLLDCRDGSIAQVPFDSSTHGLALLVMDTRAQHTLADGQYAQRRDSWQEAARQLGVSSVREAVFNDLDKTLDRLSKQDDSGASQNTS